MSVDMDVPFEVRMTRESRMLNEGPMTYDQIADHVERVAEVLSEVMEDPEVENYIEVVRDETEGHGILIKYDWHFLTQYSLALFEAGYFVTSADDGRVFVSPYKGDVEFEDPYPSLVQ